MKALCIFACVLLTASAAHAEDKLNCKSGDLNQMELNQCAGIDFNVADKKLNDLYKTLMSKYSAADGEKLKVAERAWLTYRDAECDYETNTSAGGTINSMMYTMCRTDKTNARIKDLTTQLKCPEGDLSCNMPVK